LHLVLQVLRLFLGQPLKVATLFACLKVAQILDPLLDGLKIGEHPTQPARVDIELAAALGCLSDGLLRLLLRANQEHALAVGHRVSHELVGFVEALHGLLQIKDVDAVAGGEDEGAHLGVPATCLVPKMDACLQKLLHRSDIGHSKQVLPFAFLRLRRADRGAPREPLAPPRQAPDDRETCVVCSVCACLCAVITCAYAHACAYACVYAYACVRVCTGHNRAHTRSSISQDES